MGQSTRDRCTGRAADYTNRSGQGHWLVSGVEANPANQARCLFLSDANNLDPNSGNPGGPNGPCGPFSETPAFTYDPVTQSGTSNSWKLAPSLNGTVINSVRPLGPLFDTNPWTWTIANSSYNSLQASVSHRAGSLSFLAAYTFGKCMDNASGLQDSIYPYDMRRSIALCNFDVNQNFVVNYEWDLPFDKLAPGGWQNKLASGWTFSGISTFATGLPVTLTENDDNSLIGANAAPVDVPNFAGGKVLADTNPRHGQPYFNFALFTNEKLGQFGNSRRRFFHGPGLNNWNMTLAKVTKITEDKQLELRLEAFNLFNHAQFLNPSSEINDGYPSFVNGVNQGGTFSLVTGARDPRILQLGARFSF